MYSLMDVFVLPSHREGFPRSLMEASAMRVPAWRPISGAAGKQSKMEKTGLLVPLGDVKALAQAFESILNNPPKGKIDGENGRR